MNRDPITRRRSTWRCTRRRSTWNVDGALRVLVAEEPLGWHLSISFVNHKGVPTRYPTWDEIADARDAFLPIEIGFVMHLPPADEYVALHASTFHLDEFPERAAS